MGTGHRLEKGAGVSPPLLVRCAVEVVKFVARQVIACIGVRLFPQLVVEFGVGVILAMPLPYLVVQGDDQMGQILVVQLPLAKGSVERILDCGYAKAVCNGEVGRECDTETTFISDISVFKIHHI